MYYRIPQEFKENEPFCLWRIENDKKVPYQITGQRADSSNPATFAGYDDVMACFDDRYLGIGVLTTTFTKIDIDDCVEDGTLSPLAEEVVDAINSYTEFSPSGTGIHIICYTPGIRYDKSRYYMNNRAIGMEVYVPGQTNRFFTVTGDVFRDMVLKSAQRKSRRFSKNIWCARNQIVKQSMLPEAICLMIRCSKKPMHPNKDRSSTICGRDTGMANMEASRNRIWHLRPCSHSGAAAITIRSTDYSEGLLCTVPNGMNATAQKPMGI